MPSPSPDTEAPDVPMPDAAEVTPKGGTAAPAAAAAAGEAEPKAAYSPENTLFVFDWDDTILPTTWLYQHDLKVGDANKEDATLTLIKPELQQQLDEYAEHAIGTLQEAMKYGSVKIVTNAEDGWIELTVKRFFPSWEPWIQKIPYHSARSTWEPAGFAQPVEWKVRSFTREIEAHFHNKPDVVRNVIGMGDSTSDREAILHVSGNMQNAVGKSLKFMERPSLEHLQKQHQLIHSSIRQIAGHERPLDLCIQHQVGA